MHTQYIHQSCHGKICCLQEKTDFQQHNTTNIAKEKLDHKNSTMQRNCHPSFQKNKNIYANSIALSFKKEKNVTP